MENNPYKPRSMLWALVEEDFSDLTVAQIAEVFDADMHTVYTYLSRIKRETGFVVPYRHIRRRHRKHKKRRYKKEDQL